MIGLTIGLVFGVGPRMLVLFPLIAAFALMVTALTHQFRGWLASLMVNQRRRRTIISVATLAFILLVQLPNIIGFSTGSWGPGARSSRQTAREIQKLDKALASKEITIEEYDRRVQELRGPRNRGAQRWQAIQDTARTANKIVPLGWLPYGATSLLEGKAMPAVLGILGLTAIGAVSLRRSYATTLRLYTGQFSAVSAVGSAKTESRTPKPAATGKYPAALLEKTIPGISEQASVIAFASFRSLLRAPEAKLMLLSPVVMVVIFGGMFFRGMDRLPPELVRPLMVSGGFTFVFFMMLNMMGNQFSFDRTGFRTYVLSPAPRKDILLGKNLAMAPFVLGFLLIVTALFQFRFPMRLDHTLAVLAQTVPMFLVFCLVGNVLSILAPMSTSAGSMKPVKPKATVILIHFCFVFLMPLALTPTLIPLGIEFALSTWTSLSWFPAYLIFAILECALMIWLYPVILKSQGEFLERRERKILDVVTAKTE
jgi:hypothetical protein